MQDTIRPVDYFYLELPDQPGEGARVLSALSGAGVNLLAFCGFPIEGGKVQIDLVPEDPKGLTDHASRLNLRLSARKRAFLVQGPERVGAAAAIFEKLGSKGIQVVGAQALSAGSGRWAMILWVPPAEFERAGAALGV